MPDLLAAARRQRLNFDVQTPFENLILPSRPVASPMSRPSGEAPVASDGMHHSGGEPAGG